MARSGSDPFVERVREASDIVEVIGAAVALKKMGARLGGLCPFHREKTPSFYVNPALQAFHCFGCGAGGDVFTFIMQFEKMSFPEALRHLAERAGIPMPERRGPSGDLLERIREALRAARSFYRGTLESKAGERGREYLGARGILPETREAYGLGLAPDAWDGLLRHARTLVSERTLIEAGLAAESQGGRVYDRFRNRLMIPLETASSAPVGFGARALGDQEPKYLNSPETAVYRKGTVLFGAGPARDGIRAEGRVVVVEGYFDVIALVQGGIGGAVGTCGTALTPEQARLLRRLSDRVVLLFDGDNAGMRAALRALPILAGEVDDLRIASPPPGKDPDLWIREEGSDAVRRALERAPGPLALLEERMVAGVLNRREAAGSAADLIAAVQDPLARDLWIQEASGRFQVRAEAFDRAVRLRLKKGASGGSSRDGGTPGGSDRDGLAGRRGAAETEGPPSERSWDALERACVRTALAHPLRGEEMGKAVEDAGGFDPGLPDLLRWIAACAAEESPEVSRILSLAARERPEGPRLAALSLGEGTVPDPPEAILVSVRLRGIGRRMNELQHLVRRAQEAGNQSEALRYLTQRQELARERARLQGSVPAGADAARRPDG